MEAAVTVTEGDGSVTLTVFVTGQLSSAVSVSVHLATEDGTGRQDIDWGAQQFLGSLRQDQN